MSRRKRGMEDLDQDIRDHIERETQDNIERGMPPADARYAALRKFGNMTRVAEETREVWSFVWLEQLLRDVHFGLRMLRKSPGFTTVAVLTLALGIGANTAIFSVVDAVLLRPLPFQDPGRLEDVWVNNPKHGALQKFTSYPEFLDWKKQNSVFASMAVYRETHGATLTGTGDPVRLHAAIVSPDFMDVLGVQPLMGRTFLPEEEVAGKANVAILSQDLWRTQFQSDPDIAGKSAAISGKAYRIVGVMARGFQFPILAEPIDLWLPLAAYDASMATQRGVHIYSTLARLRPGISFAQATSQINAVENRLALQYPDNHTPGDGANVSPLLPDLISGSEDALVILFGAVAIVLLIACANVANLLLVRAVGRSREFAVRCALGASRARLVQRLLTESVLLAILAGAFGLLLGYWAIGALVSVGPRDIPRLAAVHLDAQVFLFTLAVSLVTSVLFGLVPALRTSKTDLSVSLKQRISAGAGKHELRLREALIVSEVALSLISVTAAGLLLRTLSQLESVNMGFDPSHVLTFATDLPSSYNDARTTAFYDQLLPRLRALPGAKQLSAVFPLPFSGTGITTQFDIEGRPSDPASPTNADLAAAGLDYFRTMHIALLRGRDFLPADGQRGKWVAIVNQAFAKRYFPNEDPLGKRIKSDAQTSDTPAQMSTIVGVAADIKVESLREDPKPLVFVPIVQLPIGALSVVIRTRQSPGPMMSAIREQVHALEPDALVFRGKTLDQYLSVTLGQPRFSALLLTVFAGLAMLLAMIGLYGAVAYAVSQRTNEIGIRVALGAVPGTVLRLVLGRGLILALTGCAIGLAGAMLLTRLMTSLLFGVSATDPATFAGVAILMAGVAVVACYIPARRALRVDPMVALRYE
jgi:putative ABC transport system permease protein